MEHGCARLVGLRQCAVHRSIFIRSKNNYFYAMRRGGRSGRLEHLPERRTAERMTLAYLAGAMDSDGWFGIKRSTYHQRVRGDAVNPAYQERLGLKQVAPTVPTMLRNCFGGSLSQARGQTPNSKVL